MRRNRDSIIVFNLIVLLIGVSVTSGAVRQVPGDYPTIGAAIAACDDGDEIVVADGVHSGAGDPRSLYIQ